MIKGYKFITSKNKSLNGNITWKLNEWQETQESLKLCESGFHACRTPLESLQFIYGDKFCIVEADGTIIDGDDKFVASRMRIIKELPTKEIFVRFAIECAKHTLSNYEQMYPNDNRPRLAVEAAEECLLSNFSKESTLKAESAAWSAAKSAESAESAEKQFQLKKLQKIIDGY